MMASNDQGDASGSATVVPSSPTTGINRNRSPSAPVVLLTHPTTGISTIRSLSRSLGRTLFGPSHEEQRTEMEREMAIRRRASMSTIQATREADAIREAEARAARMERSRVEAENLRLALRPPGLCQPGPDDKPHARLDKSEKERVARVWERREKPQGRGTFSVLLGVIDFIEVFEYLTYSDAKAFRGAAQLQGRTLVDEALPRDSFAKTRRRWESEGHPDVERAALMTAAGSDFISNNPTKNSWGCPLEPLGNWEGIMTNDRGWVRKLTMARCNLTG